MPYLEGLYLPKTECKFVKTAYVGGRLAVHAVSVNKEPLAMVSVNIPEQPCPENHFWFKDWSENTGNLECMIEQSLVKLTGISCRTGFVTAQLVECLF